MALRYHKKDIGKHHLDRILDLVKSGKSFSFVRFSDGEIEVLRNRRLVIRDGVTEFRGRISNNNFLDFDDKIFDPGKSQCLRQDLLTAACFRSVDFYKGIPTEHNRAVSDREFMLRLNGGWSSQMTFSDLFLNSNYKMFREVFYPALWKKFSSAAVVCNWRSRPVSELSNAKMIAVPDNFFSSYEKTFEECLKHLNRLPDNALVLSSASSLSNILGYYLRLSRPDLTFLDVGTSINDKLGLPMGVRAYHSLVGNQNIKTKLKSVRYKLSKEYRLQW